MLESQKESTEAEQEGYRNEETKQQKTAEEVAKLAFSFVTAAGVFANGMNEVDDIQLLRLRTKKNEIVIVPGMISKKSKRCHAKMADCSRCQIPPRCHSRCSKVNLA